MKCRDAMTKSPAYCTKSDSVVEAGRLMKSNEVGSIPVVDDKEPRTLVGIVTDRDLAIKVVAEGANPRDVRVESVMTRDPYTCGPDDELKKAIDAMSKHQVRRIPIVDEDNRLVGIVSQADVALREDAKTTGKIVEKISEP